MDESRLNLGCGPDVREGYINLDLINSDGVDVVHDLDVYPWPFDTDQFDEILMSHVIEHLEDRESAFHELHRIIRPGGIVTMRFPHHNTPAHYTDPTHVKTITRKTPDNRTVDHLFDIVDINATRVRFGIILPQRLAFIAAEHIGKVITEVELVLRAQS